MSKRWQKKSSQIILKTPRWNVMQDDVIRSDGSKGTYEYIDRIDFGSVIPVDSQGRICLVSQYRYLLSSRTLELPRGSREKNETILASAKRELAEETGFSAKNWQKIGKAAMANSVTNQQFLVLVATDLKLGKISREGGEVDMTVEFFPLSRIERLIANGKIDDSITITSIYFYLNYLKGLKK